MFHSDVCSPLPDLELTPVFFLEEGMPFYDHFTRAGNILVTLEVEFPEKTFTPSESENIVSLLGQNSKGL